MSDSDDPALALKVRVDGAQQASSDLGSVSDATKEVGQSASQAADEVKDFKGSSDEAGSSIRETRGGLREMAKSGREMHEVMEGLSRASQGGAGAIGGVAMAVRGLILVVRTSLGPFGLLAIAIGSVIGLMMSFAGRSKEAGDALDKTGASADGVKEALQRLGEAAKKTAEQQISDFEKIHAKYEEEIKDIEEASRRTQGLNEAKSKLAQAQLELNRVTELSKASSPEQEEAINRKYDLQRESLDASIKQAEAENKIKTANDIIAKSKEEIAAFDKQIEESNAKIALADEQQKAADARVDKQRKAVANIKAPEDNPDLSAYEAQKIWDKYEADLASAKQSLTDVSVGDFKAQQNAKNVREAQLNAQEKIKKGRDEVQNRVLNEQTEISEAGLEEQTIAIEKNSAVTKTNTPSKKAVAEESITSADTTAIAAKIAELKDQQMRTLDRGQEAAIEKEISALEKTNNEIEKTGATGATEFTRASASIDKAAEKLPKALCPDPIVNSFTKYHSANLQLHKQNKQATDAVAKRVDQLAGQLAHIREKR